MSASEPPLSQLSPPGYEQTVFLPPSLPDGPFMMVDQDDADGWQDGPYDPDDFNTDPGTNILYSHNGDGHPVYLRVIHQDGNIVTIVDGEGNTHRWLLREIPDNTLAIQDPFIPDDQIALQKAQELLNG